MNTVVLFAQIAIISTAKHFFLKIYMVFTMHVGFGLGFLSPDPLSWKTLPYPQPHSSFIFLKKAAVGDGSIRDVMHGNKKGTEV